MSNRTFSHSAKTLAKTATAAGPERRLFADLEELEPAIAARAAELEAQRHLPMDLVQTLKSVGVFRLFVPRSHGGLELDLPTGLRIVSALARIDGSVGWCAMIANGGHLIAPMMARDIYDRVYGNGADTILAGAIKPSGTAEAAGGGHWRITGRWPFASGCQHADWMVGHCVMTGHGKPLPGPAGGQQPLIRGFVLPAREWQIEDTWHVAGLKGTGSHHIALRDKLVPTENFFDIATGMPCLPGPLYQTPLHLLPLLHGAISVGMAQGVLDDLIGFAGTGHQQREAALPMRDSEIFQGELGRVAADVRAAQAFLEAQAASHWRHALAGTLKDEALLVQGTQAAIWIATTCVRVADQCFMLGGGSAVYETSPLQRRLRDLHTAAQHAIVHQWHYVGAGKLLLQPACRG